MPVSKYGSAFWQRLCDSILEHLPSGWSVSFVEERRQDDYHRVTLAVGVPDEVTTYIVVPIRKEFDQLHGFQRLAVMRQAAKDYAEGIIKYRKASSEATGPLSREKR